MWSCLQTAVAGGTSSLAEFADTSSVPESVLDAFVPRTSSLPPLDWPLPNQFGQFELKIEVQPKAHHRAHYETEGSRGAVKASSGGHPLVKVGSQHSCRLH